VRHPLQRLRSGIRLYVTLEGATVLLLYLAVWFWLGLALDYGFFKLSGIDWVEESPWAIRAGVLIVLVAGLLALVAMKILLRLLTNFRDSALALVLERRFPRLLGDRLITAVELANVKKAARYGYSREMIEQTIVEAADRVDRAPVNEVFTWGRLITRGVLVGLLIVGLYLLAVVAFCAADIAQSRRASLAGLDQFHEVATTWFERNVLLRDQLWPRRAFLELVNFPASGELRIGQDAPPPTLRARALKWIIADPAAPQKWRSLSWADLQARPELLGGDKPPPVPEWWPEHPGAWTVDEVELQLDRLEADRVQAVQKTVADLDRIANTADGKVRKNPPPAGREGKWLYTDNPGAEKWRPLVWSDLSATLPDGVTPAALPGDWFPAGSDPTLDQVEEKLAAAHPDELNALKTDVLDRLGAVEASHRLRRTLRKVTIPNTVYAIARGASSTSTITLQKTGDNEYAGAFTDLKESVRFTVQGEDYYTPYRRITLVPPPSVVSMMRDEYQPAYLYYRVAEGSTAGELKASKQVFRNLVSSVSGGDTTRIQVPRGTDLVLTVQLDKDLYENTDLFSSADHLGVGIAPPRPGVPEVKAPIKRLDAHTFQTRFDDVHTLLDFVFIFTDTDHVEGHRHVIIKPLEDNPPEVDVQVEVIRKTRDGYMVTPFALVPFSGKVRDDHGLDDVSYACTLTKLDTQVESGGKALLLLSDLYQLGAGTGQDLVTALELAFLAKGAEPGPTDAEDKGPEKLPVQAFVDALAQRAEAQVGREVFKRDAFLMLLEHNPYDPLDVPDPQDASKTKRVRHPLTLPREKETDPIVLRSLFGEYTFEPDKPAANFDMQKLARGPKVATVNEIQTRYRMQVWVEGTDNDLLTGPHHSLSKEKFTFIVVGVNELLSEIGKEEEGLHLKLKDMTDGLEDSRKKLEKVLGDLGTGGFQADQFQPLSVQDENVEQVRAKAEQATQDVLNDYRRILREMQANRVERIQPGIITKVERTIANPLDDVLHAEFPRARDGLEELRKVIARTDLDAQAKVDEVRKASVEAEGRVELLIQKLSAILDAMGKLDDINSLVRKLREVEESERAQYDVLEKLRKQVLEQIGTQLFTPSKPKDKK
jgi:hypothetical protein